MLPRDVAIHNLAAFSGFVPTNPYRPQIPLLLADVLGWSATWK
jgi:hypothetical protein